jgi:hypothetical protein
MAFSRPTAVQTILFDRQTWTVSAAKGWLRRHDRKIPKVDTTKDYLRFRQAPPSQFESGTFRTIPFGRQGIKAVIAVPKKRLKNPSTRVVRLPRVVVDLGRCVEIEWEDGSLWSPRKPSIHLCCSESGRTLWVFSVSRERTHLKPKSSLYRRFTGFYESGVRTASVREPSKLTYSRYVKAVVYESDKKTGKKTHYIHTFRSRPRAYCDRLSDPSFIKISGGKIRVQSVGITG